MSTDSESSSPAKGHDARKSNRFRLERFGKAMSGTEGWETPGAVLNGNFHPKLVQFVEYMHSYFNIIGFDWHSLPNGSTVVDVGGGIGSTTMLLATAFASEGPRLKFIIQDRPVVCEMGEKVTPYIISRISMLSDFPIGMESKISRVVILYRHVPRFVFRGLFTHSEDPNNQPNFPYFPP
jgi:hypothetical protein